MFGKTKAAFPQSTLLEAETYQISGITVDSTELLSQSEPTTDLASELIIFPVGIYVGNRSIIESTLIRGFEDGEQAVDLENWLVPFEQVQAALKLNVTPLENGQLEIRSPGLVTRIDAQAFTTDNELGLAISVEQIETLLGVPTTFDIEKYALVFNPPWLGVQQGRVQVAELPVIIEGLPRTQAPSFGFSGIGQRVNLTRNNDSSLNYQGELTTVGTALGGSWYLRLNQSDLGNLSSWQLGEAQYLRQTDSADYVLGSHPTFWRSDSGGEFFGVTTVQRWGFAPPTASTGGGGFNLSSRLQPESIDYNIAGEAAPGTLVQLRRGLSTTIIDEVLVDSSGVYRFDNVPAARGFGSYRVFLYPNGILTAEPEIRDAEFTSLAGQLSPGDSALVVSAGMRRTALEGLLGEFSDFRGGVAYRRGITEQLTLGVGAFYDQSPQVLGELFYSPENFPLEVALSAQSRLDGGDFDLSSNIRFQPFSNLTAQFSRDRFSQRFNINWQTMPGLTLIASGNSADGSLAGGFRYSYSSQSFSTFAGATLDTNSNLRWNINSRWRDLQFIQQGSEIGTNTELSYALFGTPSSPTHALFASYETRNANSLAALGWRYRSDTRLVGGGYLWQVDLGYGIGSQGYGIVTSASTGILPGTDLRLRYQGVSTVSNESSFRLEFVPRLNFSGGLSPGNRQLEYLRSQGGLLIQPFFDQNNNGKWDRGEKLYTEDADLLLILNNKPLRTFRPDPRKDGFYITLPPDTYRLDLDPAGFPLDWQPITTAYAVDVVAGSYTPIRIPFTLSYTVAGTVTDAEGKPIGGARVEAVPVEEGKSVLSITNGAGIFFLEGLQQGTYNLLVNGQPANPKTIEINPDTETLQEINLRF